MQIPEERVNMTPSWKLALQVREELDKALAVVNIIYDLLEFI